MSKKIPITNDIAGLKSPGNSFRFRVWIICLIFSLMPAMGWAQSTNTGAEVGPIKKVIKKFAYGLDKQNASKLKSTLHRDFREVYYFQDKLHTENAQQLLEMVRSKKIGGKPRTLKIQDIQVAGNFAQARAILVSPVLRFEHLFHLIKEAGEWKINHTVLDVKPVKSADM